MTIATNRRARVWIRVWVRSISGPGRREGALWFLGITAPNHNLAFKDILWGNRQAMIKLTRLDGEAFVLNAELIRYVERRGDTFVTLTTGERFVVAESMDDVVDRSLHYQRQKYFLPPISHAIPSQAPTPKPASSRLSHD